MLMSKQIERAKRDPKQRNLKFISDKKILNRDIAYTHTHIYMLQLHSIFFYQI